MVSDEKIQKIKESIEAFDGLLVKMFWFYGGQMPAENELKLTKDTLNKIRDILAQGSST